MAYKITRKPTFVARVMVETPNDKGGHDRSSFNAEFKRVRMDEIDDLKKLPSREALEQVLVGWSEFLDQDNNPVEFNEATRWAMFNEPPAFLALLEAFWGSILKAREKN